MKIQEALDTIDDMIGDIEAAHVAERNRATCTDRSFYDDMDARHSAAIDRYRNLRDDIERGLDYQ